MESPPPPAPSSSSPKNGTSTTPGHDAIVSTNLAVQTIPNTTGNESPLDDQLLAEAIEAQHEQHLLTLEPEEDNLFEVPEDNGPNIVTLPEGVTAEQIEHVIVLAHGINGFSTDMDGLEKSIRKHSAFMNNTIILKSKSNQAKRTHEGIEVAGMRLAAEIIDILSAINIRPPAKRQSNDSNNVNNNNSSLSSSSNGVNLRASSTSTPSSNDSERNRLRGSSKAASRTKLKLSICGHSLGGLISRNAIGHLEILGILEMLDCVSYVSLATPHFGSRRVGGEFGHYGKAIWQKMVHFAVSWNGDTGKQLILEDTADPLLIRMTKIGSPYMTGLSRFRNRTAGAITHNDVLVPFPGACIRTRNPYPPPAWNAPNKLIIEATTGFPLAYDPIFSAFRRSSPLPPQFDISLDPFPGEATSKGLYCDHLHTVEYHPDIVANLNSIPWRRIELHFGGGPVGLHVHEQVVKTKKHWKAPFLNETVATNFVDMVAEMLALDHMLAT